MGCTTSANKGKVMVAAGASSDAPQGPELDNRKANSVPSKELPTFTADFIETIRSSWKDFVELENMHILSLKMFTRLFQEYPDSGRLFPFVEGMSEEELTNNIALRWHVRRVTGQISEAVILMDNTESFVRLLLESGARHADRGAQQELLVPIGEGLIRGMEKGLKENFTKRHKEAWTEFYGVMSRLFVQGMKS